MVAPPLLSYVLEVWSPQNNPPTTPASASHANPQKIVDGNPDIRVHFRLYEGRNNVVATICQSNQHQALSLFDSHFQHLEPQVLAPVPSPLSHHIRLCPLSVPFLSVLSFRLCALPYPASLLPLVLLGKQSLASLSYLPGLRRVHYSFCVRTYYDYSGARYLEINLRYPFLCQAG